MFTASTKVTALSLIVLAMSGVASAAPQTQSPFSLAQAEMNLSQTSENYINSGASLSRAELSELEAKLLKNYGMPTSTRGNLKIWEVPNEQAGLNQAKHTTIMSGIDQDGSQVFVIDSRGAAQADNPRLTQTQPTRKNRALTAQKAPTRPAQKLNDWD